MMSANERWEARDTFDGWRVWSCRSVGADGRTIGNEPIELGDELPARQIVADHNACLGITHPETTVPELIRICQLASMRMATVDPNITLEEAVQEAFKLSREAESVLAKCGEVER